MSARKPPEILSVRLGAEHRRVLDQMATRAGLDLSEYVRRVLSDHMGGSSEIVLKRELGAVQREVAKLRIDLSTAVKVLLVATGQSADRAERWVEENLRAV